MTKTHTKTTPSEAVMAFADWLTRIDEGIEIGGNRNCSVIAKLVDKFNLSQGFEPIRDNYTDMLKPYPKD